MVISAAESGPLAVYLCGYEHALSTQVTHRPPVEMSMRPVLQLAPCIQPSMGRLASLTRSRKLCLVLRGGCILRSPPERLCPWLMGYEARP